MKKILILFAALIAAASCAESALESGATAPGAEKSVSYKVSTPQTRVAVGDDYKVTWAAGDDMSLLPLTYEYVSGDYDLRSQLTIGDISADGESATFSGETTSSAASFRLVHPYSSTDIFESKTIDDVSFASYVCTLDTQEAGLTKTYMVSKEIVDSVDGTNGVEMNHVGAAIILNTTFVSGSNIIGEYTLTSVAVSSPDNKFFYRNQINLEEYGMVMTNTTAGTSVINVGETVAESMSFSFNVFPFELAASESLTFEYTFTSIEDGTTTITRTKTITDTEISIERATYNTFNLSVNLADAYEYETGTVMIGGDYSVGSPNVIYLSLDEDSTTIVVATDLDYDTIVFDVEADATSWCSVEYGADYDELIINASANDTKQTRSAVVTVTAYSPDYTVTDSAQVTIVQAVTYEVGDFVYDENNKANGIVCYVDTDGIRAMALSFETSNVKWAYNNITTAEDVAMPYLYSTYNVLFGAADCLAYLKTFGFYDIAGFYPAWQWAQGLGEDWYLPTRTDWDTLMDIWCGTADDSGTYDMETDLNDAMIAAGGTPFDNNEGSAVRYWGSTLSDGDAGSKVRNAKPTNNTSAQHSKTSSTPRARAIKYINCF